MSDLLLAIFIIAVGLSVAGMLAQLYHYVWREPASLSYSGKTNISAFGNLVISFFCGPYIMLNLGWKREITNNLSLSLVFISAVVALSWAFITGLLFLSAYLGVFS